MGRRVIDGQPTRVVVCLITPKKQNREHLRVLGCIAQLFDSAAFRAKLPQRSAAE